MERDRRSGTEAIVGDVRRAAARVDGRDRRRAAIAAPTGRHAAAARGRSRFARTGRPHRCRAGRPDGCAQQLIEARRSRLCRLPGGAGSRNGACNDSVHRGPEWRCSNAVALDAPGVAAAAVVARLCAATGMWPAGKRRAIGSRGNGLLPANDGRPGSREAGDRLCANCRRHRWSRPGAIPRQFNRLTSVRRDSAPTAAARRRVVPVLR